MFKMDCRIASVSIGNNGQAYGNGATVSATANAVFDLEPPAAVLPAPPKP